MIYEKIDWKVQQKLSHDDFYVEVFGEKTLLT